MAWHGRDWKHTCIALGARDYRNDTKSLVLIFRLVKCALCLYGCELLRSDYEGSWSRLERVISTVCSRSLVGLSAKDRSICLRLYMRIYSALSLKSRQAAQLLHQETLDIPLTLSALPFGSESTTALRFFHSISPASISDLADEISDKVANPTDLQLYNVSTAHTGALFRLSNFVG
jgi:hypothetical protein